MRLVYQCPGCFADFKSEPPKANQYFECSCGEQLACIDLRQTTTQLSNGSEDREQR